MKSLITYFLLSIALIVFSFTYYPKYKQGGGEATISWDVSGYYWYLPGLFIYKDLKELKFSDSLRNAYNCSADNQQITYLPDGTKTLKYSSGMAVQYLPFFLIANSIAKPLGFPADGLSKPYQLAIHWGALFMCLLGLWYLRKLLLLYFKDSTVAITLFLLVIGTNYLDYAAIDLGMTHSWLFTWYCLLIYFSDSFYKKSSNRKAIIIGAILGIIALTRPTELLAVIIPILWGTDLINWDSIKQRFQFIISNFTKYMLAVMVMIMIGSIQLFYWKYATGHWFVYSYGDQEFSWLHPHVFLYSTSYQCGWLRYCPMMILPYFGFLALIKRKNIFWALSIFSFLFFWIVTAWDIWNYGGRAMIQGYPILMFPFSALIEFSLQRKWLMAPFALVVGICLYLNIWWVHGVHKGEYVYATDMSEAYYKKVVGHWHINEQDRKLLDVSEDFTGSIRQSDTLLNEKLYSTILIGENGIKDSFLFLKSDSNVNVTFNLQNKSLKNDWIRANADIQCIQRNWDIIRMTEFGIRFFKNGQNIKQNRILLDRLFYKDSSQLIYIDAHLKPNDYDSLQVFFHSDSVVKGTFVVRNILIESFN